MGQIRTGEVEFIASQQAAPHLVNVAEPIVDLRLRLTGELNVTVTVALEADGILRLVQRLQLDKGGRQIFQIGDNSVNLAAFRMYHFLDQYLYGHLPELSQPALVAGVNPFSATITIPFSLPKSLYKQLGQGRHATALLPEDQEVRLRVDWGAVADVISSGTATLQNVQLEVVALTVPGFRDRKTGVFKRPPNILRQNTQSVTLETAADPSEEITLNKNGVLPFLYSFFTNNGVRADAQLNRIEYRKNARDTLMDQDWESYRQDSQMKTQLHAALPPAGTSLMIFDEDLDLSGALDLDNPALFTSFRARIDHDALTTPRFAQHAFFLDEG